MRDARPALSLARTALVLSLAVSMALGPMPGVAAGRSVEIMLGKAKGFTHIEFGGAQPASIRREGQVVILRFGGVEEPNLALLNVTPPPYLESAVTERGKDGMSLRLTLAKGAVANFGKADGRSYINLLPEPAADKGAVQSAAAGPSDQRPTRKVGGAPSSGVVQMKAELQGKTLFLRFPWRAPVGATVARRGEAIWVVFDTPAKINLDEAPRGLLQMRSMQAVATPNATALRIIAPPNIIATASEDAATWTIALGPEAANSATAVEVVRDDVSGPASLTARMAGSSGVFWINDPVVGDRFAAVTALGPAKALAGRREFVDATLLPTTQGLLVEPAVDDLTVAAEGDLVRIGRPRGLALSHVSAQVRHVASTVADAPQPSSLPALIDFNNWSKLPPAGFGARYAQLTDAAAEEAGKKAGGVQARLALARFLVGSELNYEAIGVLDLLAKTTPTMMGDPEFRGLRGAARTMVRRYKEAQADFSSPVVADDPASALWRGYIATKLTDYTGAREQFLRGKSALAQFAPRWRSRFALADSESALQVGDLGAARAAMLQADPGGLEGADAEAVSLARARLLDASGQPDQALPVYEQAANSAYGGVAAPALLRATEIKLSRGKMPLADAVQTMDSLRFRWRGDSTELETIRALGKIYLGRGRYRDALEALRSAGRRMPDLPAAVQVQADLSTAFKNLFLDGLADGLEPIQALALFYDFRELTPIGADGDMMVRKMVRRLVDVDLLDQAAELLKYQVENRLDGIARAEVATDLATIDLMNRKPEAALIAINTSRTTLLPAAMNAERRVLEARALVGLGRYDHALEVLGKDNTGEAAAVKAEIAWKQQAWPAAGQMLEAQLGDRWKSATPLTADEENRLLRAGVAYSLAGDDAALARLRTRYAKLTDDVRAPDAMKVALSGGDDAPMSAGDFMRVSSDADTFAGWVARMKKRLRDKPTPGAAPAAPAAKPPAKPTVATNAPARPAAKG